MLMRRGCYSILVSVFMFLLLCTPAMSDDGGRGRNDDAPEIMRVLLVNATSGEVQSAFVRYMQKTSNDDNWQVFSLWFFGDRNSVEWQSYVDGGEKGVAPALGIWRVKKASQGLITNREVRERLFPHLSILRTDTTSQVNKPIHTHQGAGFLYTAELENKGRGEKRFLPYGSFKITHVLPAYPLSRSELTRWGKTDFVYTTRERAFLDIEAFIDSAAQEPLGDSAAMGMALFVIRHIDSSPRIVRPVLHLFRTEVPPPFLSRVIESDGKITICHNPPGNDEQGHTIRIDPSALYTHLEHGDILGTCPLTSDSGKKKDEKKEDKGKKKK